MQTSGRGGGGAYFKPLQHRLKQSFRALSLYLPTSGSPETPHMVFLLKFHVTLTRKTSQKLRRGVIPHDTEQGYHKEAAARLIVCPRASNSTRQGKQLNR